MTSEWRTPPGRFFTTIGEIGMTIPMIMGVILLIAGLVIMGIEYFIKEK